MEVIPLVILQWLLASIPSTQVLINITWRDSRVVFLTSKQDTHRRNFICFGVILLSLLCDMLITQTEISRRALMTGQAHVLIWGPLTCLVVLTLCHYWICSARYALLGSAPAVEDHLEKVTCFHSHAAVAVWSDDLQKNSFPLSHVHTFAQCSIHASVMIW